MTKNNTCACSGTIRRRNALVRTVLYRVLVLFITFVPEQGKSQIFVIIYIIVHEWFFLTLWGKSQWGNLVYYRNFPQIIYIYFFFDVIELR